MKKSHRDGAAHLRPRTHHFALEARQLFDGAALVEAAHQADAAEAPHAAPAPAADAHGSEHAPTPLPATPESVAPPAEGAPAAPAATVYVVDQGIANWQTLVSQLPQGSEVILIDSGSAGTAQLAQALAGRTNIGALHILSHGSDGGIALGNQTLTAGTLAGSAADWQAIGAALTDDGDILLYGCDVAAGSTAFVDQLAALTQADVAASSDATGAAVRGGDWDLEARSGSVETAALAGLAYDGLLASPTVSDSATATRVTAEDTPLAITGVTVGDSDNPASLTVTVTANGGNILLAGSGWSIVSGANGSASVTISGSIAQVNSALAGMQFTPQADRNSSTAGYVASVVVTANDGETSSAPRTVAISVTAVNDAPVLNGTTLNVAEGGNAVFTLQQLAPSANALDVDIATGQQALAQQMMRVDSLPTHGTLTYKGGPVLVGTVIPVSDLANLRYTHNGNDVATNLPDSFNITVNDGGGATTSGAIGILIAPTNVNPAFTGEVSMYEGQIKSVMPGFTLGDSFDTPANSTLTVNSVTTNGQGVFFFDANNDNVIDAGELVTGPRSFSAADAAKFKFMHNGSEPNAPGATAPSFSVTLNDAGGGTGVPGSTGATVVTIDVHPNNDDPTLTTHQHSTPGTALPVSEFEAAVLTSGMLQISDVDRDPADTAQLWPADRLVYTIASLPTHGQIQLQIGATWYALAAGGRFTQADVDAGRVRYVNTGGVAATGDPDGFTFTVRDSAYGYDLSDPANPSPSLRAGGIYDSNGDLVVHEFHITLIDNDAGVGPGPGAVPLASSIVGNGTDASGAGTWRESNISASGGAITDQMLEWVITRSNGVDSFVVPPSEVVYTLTSVPGNGTLEREVSPGNWQTLAIGSVFTQADINAGTIRFQHDGGEQFTSTFNYNVSDGNVTRSSTFSIDVAPVNDAPVADGGSAIVPEGGTVYLGAGAVGMHDVDGAILANGSTTPDPVKRLETEGNVDELWFRVTTPVDPARGVLQRWDGGAWVDVTTSEWLSSRLLTTATPDGASGLRYVHNGSEPLAYAGGPSDRFDFEVRDDLGAPGSGGLPGVFGSISTADPTFGSVPPSVTPEESHLSNIGQVVIGIVPVNEAPQIANAPNAPDPVITGGVIAGGGATTGANEVLAVSEGTTTVITNAYLQAVDPDNTTEQRQFRITQVPTSGTLLLNGTALGLGSTFTQADIDAGRLSYRHAGGEPVSGTYAGLNYNDKFHFIVDDGVAADAGADANHNVFLITVGSTNDAPVVAAPGGPVRLDNAAGGDPLPGFSVTDPDITAGNTDVMQVVVRLLNDNSTPFTEAQYDARGVTLDATITGGVKQLVTTAGGADAYLVLRGTREQINTALASLTVSFASDQDAPYRVQVIADDRVRDLATGALVDSDAGTPGVQPVANGGTENQNSGSPVAVPSTDGFDWYTVGASGVPAGLAGNMAASSVRVFASSTNDVPDFSGPAGVTVYEDQALFIGSGFTIGDAESEAFDLPVTVTFSIPSAQGTLSIGTLTGVTVTNTVVGGNQVITLTGHADLIENLVRNTGGTVGGGLTYTTPAGGNLDYNGAAPGSVTLTASFSEGTSAIGGAVGGGASVPNVVTDLSIPITIVPVNDRPTVGSSGPTVPLVGTTPVPGFVVGDVDINGDIDSNPATIDVSAGEVDFMQVTVRILDNATGNPLAASAYADTTDPLAPVDYITISSSTPGTATVDTTSDGTGSVLVVRGTLAEVNAYLAGLQVKIEGPLANVDATYRVQVIADDRTRDLATGALTGTANGGDNPAVGGGASAPSATEIDPYATVGIPGALTANMNQAQRLVFPTDLNDPGQITVPGTLAVNEGSATVTLNGTIGNITLLDPDAGAANTMTVTVSVPAGFTIDSVGGAGSVTVIDARTVVITGSQADLNSSLKAITIGLPDEPGAPTAGDWNGSFDVTLVYDDKGNTGVRPGTLTGDGDDPTSGNGDYEYVDTAPGSSDNALKTTRVLTIVVNAVNDAPQLANPADTVVTTPPAQADRPASLAGQSVTDLFADQYSDPLDPITGGSSSDSFHGVAIIGPVADPAQGAWQYQLDGAGPWIAVGSPSAANALVLDGNDRLRFVPAADFAGTPTPLTVRLVETGDGGNGSAPPAGGSTVDLSGGTGGTTRYSAGTLTLTTSVAALSLTVTDGNGVSTGDATVYEQGLTDSGGSQATTGSFVVNVPDGIDHITVGGTDVTLGQLTGLPGTPVAPITTPMGRITITSYDPATGTVGYRYELTTPQTHGVPEVTDTIAVSVTDTDGDTVGGNIRVLVIDDVPAANNDAAGIQLGGPSNTVGGNVLAGGGAGDVADRPGADGPATVTGLTGGAIGVPLAATYGTLTLNADGSYSFAVNTAHPAVQNLYSGQTLVQVFTYTITDADGDTAQATLTITILGPDNRTPPPIFNGLDLMDPPAITQPFVPALFVQLAVQDSAALIGRLSGQMGDGLGSAFGEEIQGDILGIDQDMSNAQHVSRDGVAFSKQLLAEGQSRARGLGNSLVIGAQSLFDDFSPFGPNPAEAGGDDAAAAEAAPAAPAAPATPAPTAEGAPRDDAARVAAVPRAAPSFSAQLGAMAGAQAVMREAQAAAAREGAAAQPVKVARAQPVRA